MKNSSRPDSQTRVELANSLYKVARGGGSLREAIDATQEAKDAIVESMAAMHAQGEGSNPEYRGLQQMLDDVIKAHAALDSASKAARRFGYV